MARIPNDDTPIDALDWQCDEYVNGGLEWLSLPEHDDVTQLWIWEAGSTRRAEWSIVTDLDAPQSRELASGSEATTDDAKTAALAAWHAILSRTEEP